MFYFHTTKQQLERIYRISYPIEPKPIINFTLLIYVPLKKSNNIKRLYRKPLVGFSVIYPTKYQVQLKGCKVRVGMIYEYIYFLISLEQKD